MMCTLQIGDWVAEEPLPYVRQALEDWELSEQILQARQAAEEREVLLQAAFSLAPPFKLFPLERNWWVATIDDDSGLPFPNKLIDGARESLRLNPQTLIIQSDLPASTLLENIEMLYLPF